MISSNNSCPCLLPSPLSYLYPNRHHFNVANIFETRRMLYLTSAVSHLTSQLLVLLHQFLVLLVDGQHFTDTVSSRLSLKENQNSNFYTARIYLLVFCII